MSLLPLLVCSILIDPFLMSYLLLIFCFLSPLVYLCDLLLPLCNLTFYLYDFSLPFVNNHQKVLILVRIKSINMRESKLWFNLDHSPRICNLV
jgi:hypothetical protein